MLTRPKLTLLALALAAALPAAAQTNAEVLNELKALRDRVNQLEQELKEARPRRPRQPTPQWGMTPEQAAELNRLTVKTEALEDSREASGFMGLKISGQMQTDLHLQPERRTWPASSSWIRWPTTATTTTTPTSAWRCSTSRRRCTTAPSGA